MIARAIYWLWSFLTSTTRMWQALEGAGIVVFVGPNGSGKSLVMVESTLATLAGRTWECYDVEHRHHRAFRDHAAVCPSCDVPSFLAMAPVRLDDVSEAVARAILCDVGGGLITSGATGERTVYSTVPLTESKGVPHPRFVGLTNYQQLLTIEHADVLFDEVAGIADASSSGSMPVQVVNWQHQLRKRDIRQRVTTPAYARCALPIRQVAQVVVECKSFFPIRRSTSLWRPRRIVRATVYDAWDFEDFIASEGQRDRLRPLAKGLIWVPDSPALAAYNSFGQVLQLGHVTESGMCIACGGSRSRPKCACGEDVHGVDPELLRIETERTASGATVKRAVLDVM